MTDQQFFFFSFALLIVSNKINQESSFVCLPKVFFEENGKIDTEMLQIKILNDDLPGFPQSLKGSENNFISNDFHIFRFTTIRHRLHNFRFLFVLES